MDNTTPSPVGDKKSITLSSLASWVFGILFLIVGISGLFSQPLFGIALLLASILILPPAYRYVSNALHLNLSRGVRAVIIIVLFIIVGANMDTPPPTPTPTIAENKTTPPAEAQPDTPIAEVTPPAAVVPKVSATPSEKVVAQPVVTPPVTPSVPSFKNGNYVVGTEVQPGTYRTRSASSGCYFSRLSGFGGALSEIISNENTDYPAIITIASTDKGFKSSRCATWTQDISRITASQTSFGSGNYIVGVDILPGTYKSSGDSRCYYARLRSFTGTMSDIIANENTDTSAIVTIAPTDKGFKSSGCGTWNKID